MSILEFPPLPLFYYFFFLSSCIGTSIDSSGTCQFIAFGCCASNLMILKVFYVLILCWLSTWTRNFKLEWTTLRLGFAFTTLKYVKDNHHAHGTAYLNGIINKAW
ncbi:uncharacterized protein LOC110269085 isoform X4 [Arachis ipaensis]|uniref:uncharacterized protein LOC110269085 isoform X4 n=1 Tax=Arachis ipaensis TaxID=130454 RepID=UPI000A2B8654|nr:uncharacterized protein LOC110269085 isoform X4 [Arachis ipaensis]